MFSGDLSPDKVFNALLSYMSIQKFRTPKGLRYLSSLVRQTDKNRLLFRDAAPAKPALRALDPSASGRLRRRTTPRRSSSSQTAPSPSTIVKSSRTVSTRGLTQIPTSG